MLSSTALEHYHRANPEWTTKKSITWRKAMQWEQLASFTLTLTNIRNVTQHSFCPRFCRGSVQRRCCRCKLIGLERCTAIDRQACSLRRHEAVKGYEKLAILSLIFVLRKKGSETKERMKEEETEKGNCRPPTRKVFFWDFVGLEPSST